MRRYDREINSFEDIVSIVNKCKVIRLAINAEEYPYLVPLNFGYSRAGDTLTFYFHCAKAGRKLELLRVNPKVGFEMDASHALVEGAVPCQYGYCYESIIGTGTVEFLEGDAKCAALSHIMQHQTGKEFSFDNAKCASVEVGCLHVKSLSGKARRT